MDICRLATQLLFLYHILSNAVNHWCWINFQAQEGTPSPGSLSVPPFSWQRDELKAELKAADTLGEKISLWIVSCDGRGFRWTLCPRRGRHCQRMKPSSTNTHRGEKSWAIEKERKKQDHSFWTPGFIWSRGNYSPGSPKCMSHLLLFLNQLELGFCHYKNTYDQYRTSAKLLRTTALNRMQQQPTVRMRMVVETGCKRHESLRRRIHLQCRLSSKHTAFPLSLTHRSLVLPM